MTTNQNPRPYQDIDQDGPPPERIPHAYLSPAVENLPDYDACSLTAGRARCASTRADHRATWPDLNPAEPIGTEPIDCEPCPGCGRCQRHADADESHEADCPLIADPEHDATCYLPGAHLDPAELDALAVELENAYADALWRQSARWSEALTGGASFPPAYHASPDAPRTVDAVRALRAERTYTRESEAEAGMVDRLYLVPWTHGSPTAGELLPPLYHAAVHPPA